MSFIYVSGVLIDYAFRELGASKISLGIFENNRAAINCYLAAGFHPVSMPEPESYEYLGKTWECIEMEQRCEAYRQ